MKGPMKAKLCLDAGNKFLLDFQIGCEFQLFGVTNGKEGYSNLGKVNIDKLEQTQATYRSGVAHVGVLCSVMGGLFQPVPLDIDKLMPTKFKLVGTDKVGKRSAK